MRTRAYAGAEQAFTVVAHLQRGGKRSVTPCTNMRDMKLSAFDVPMTVVNLLVVPWHRKSL